MNNIKSAKHVHFTGIKGVGLTSIALCVRDLGAKITGSDVEEEFVTDEVLKRNGLSWSVGFDAKNLEPKPDILVYTGAHGGLTNPEVVAAKEMGIPVLSHFEALAQLAEGKKLIAVCGVGGKTTTSAMIATILEYAGTNPSWAIGVSDIPSLSGSGHFDIEGEYFVTEADEFVISPGADNRPKFHLLNPHIVVVTNIEHDHPDVYPTFSDTEKAYKEFFEKLPDNGFLLINADNKNSMNLLQKEQKNYGFEFSTYGKELGLWQFRDETFKDGRTEFKLKTDMLDDDNWIDAILHVPGIFNLYNATAAYAVSQTLLIDPESTVEALDEFKGCKRRFEKVAEVNGILFYDDYAHHPEEIKATLKATREWFPDKRIVVVFQPHTYSRTKALFTDFAKSFNAADIVGISDIFASAREEKNPSVSSEKLVEEIKKYHPHPEHVGYLGNLENAAKISKSVLKEGDVFMTLGAGDIYKIHKLILKNTENPEV